MTTVDQCPDDDFDKRRELSQEGLEELHEVNAALDGVLNLLEQQCTQSDASCSTYCLLGMAKDRFGKALRKVSSGR